MAEGRAKRAFVTEKKDMKRKRQRREQGKQNDPRRVKQVGTNRMRP